MALTTRVWSAGKLLFLVGALFLTYVVFAFVGMRVALRTREVQVPTLGGRTVNEATAVPFADIKEQTRMGAPSNLRKTGMIVYLSVVDRGR